MSLSWTIPIHTRIRHTPVRRHSLTSDEIACIDECVYYGPLADVCIINSPNPQITCVRTLLLQIFVNKFINKPERSSDATEPSQRIRWCVCLRLNGNEMRTMRATDRWIQFKINSHTIIIAATRFIFIMIRDSRSQFMNRHKFHKDPSRDKSFKEIISRHRVRPSPQTIFVLLNENNPSHTHSVAHAKCWKFLCEK